MEQKNDEVRTDFVKSADGTVISCKVVGKGPGLVIVHGAFRASQHYLRLAESLSDTFTVYIVDRRGRNKSGAKGSDYSVQKDCEDVIALLKKYNVSFVFGHSFGGLVGLNIALQYPLAKLAVYEPAVGSHIPVEWLSTFERELEHDDYISASVTFLKGLRMGGALGKLPKPLLKIMFRQMAKEPDWEENIQLLRTLPGEVQAVLRMDTGIERYRKVQVPTLVMSGKKSPEYLIGAARELGAILHDPKSILFEGLDHNAPDENAPEKIAKALKDFFK